MRLRGQKIENEVEVRRKPREYGFPMTSEVNGKNKQTKNPQKNPNKYM